MFAPLRAKEMIKFIPRLVLKRRISGSPGPLKKTPLYNLHVKNNAKMVAFAGHMMPVRYADQTITESHRHTREHSSIFDVSHMMLLKIHGANRLDFLESLTVADLKALADNTSCLSVFSTPQGTIIDDLIVSKCTDHLFIVGNASRAARVLDHLRTNSNFWENAEIDEILDHALIAVQGPETQNVLEEALSLDLRQLKFMQTTECKLGGALCRITRCGYTGEDGVEIAIPAEHAEPLVERMLSSRKTTVKLAGLGARDTLRLEAGLCLYGNDIDEETTIVEAGLTWTIGKRRRKSGGFPGYEIVKQQIETGPGRKRVGLISDSPLPARKGTEVFSGGKIIGKVSSGGPSPTLGRNIAMAYINSVDCIQGSNVQMEIRGKSIGAEIVKLPFVSTKYFI